MKNYSKQREEILDFLMNSKIHPTAEKIFEEVKKQDSSISRGTVYRNLKELVNENFIIKISMNDGPDRYDYIHKKHNHVICKYCGKVKDFEYDFDSPEACSSVFEQTGMDSTLNSIVVYGICKECKKKKDRKI